MAIFRSNDHVPISYGFLTNKFPESDQMVKNVSVLTPLMIDYWTAVFCSSC